jgi:ferredoxin/mono/diheme cytochrome c family protein
VRAPSLAAYDQIDTDADTDADADADGDVDGDRGTQARRPLAVVDADACVGCGICIGSCSFGAMTLPGFDAPDPVDAEGRRVVIACQRHLDAADESALDDDVVVVPVACSGMIHANAVGSLIRAGATGVQIVGCPPGDCAYGMGNTILDERLQSGRAPHVPPKYAGVATEDYVPPGELIDAIAHPHAHPSPDADTSIGARRMVGAGLVVVASVAAVAFATRAPYAGADDVAGLLVVVDHTPGFQLEGQPAPTGGRGDTVEIVTLLDGDTVSRDDVPRSGDNAAGLVDVEFAPGEQRLSVVLVEGDDETSLFDGSVALASGERLVVNAIDVPPPASVAEGEQVFDDRSLGSCDVCHSVRPGDDGVGPSLAGVAERATTAVPGLDAESYLRQSILDPNAFIVDGYRADQMLDVYDERLSDAQLDALVEYLLTLTGGGE